MSSHALYEPMGLAKVTSWMIPTSSCSLRLSRARRSEEARRRVSAAAIAVSSPCSLHGSSHEDGLHRSRSDSADEISKARHSTRCTFKTSRKRTFTFKTGECVSVELSSPRAPHSEHSRHSSVKTRIALSRKRLAPLWGRAACTWFPDARSDRGISPAVFTDSDSKDGRWIVLDDQRHQESRETVDTRDRRRQTSSDGRVHEIN